MSLSTLAHSSYESANENVPNMLEESENSANGKKNSSQSGGNVYAPGVVPAIEVHENVSRSASPQVEASPSKAHGDNATNDGKRLSGQGSSEVSSNTPFFASAFGLHAFGLDHYRRSSIGVEYLSSRLNNSSQSQDENGGRSSFWTNASLLQPAFNESTDGSGGQLQRRRSSQAKICTLECAVCRKMMLSAVSDRNLSAIESVSTLSESKSCELHSGNAENEQTENNAAQEQASAVEPEQVLPSQRTDIQEMMNKCWPQETGDRPDFKAFKAILHNLQKNGDTQGIILALNRLEEYANSLEHLVEDRTNDFFDAKHKAEALLYQVMPYSVAQELISGVHPKPQHYESVTINFIDIVGFTVISATSTPIEIIDFLNDLYNCFDYIIGNFDVYKVETIGDSYMVASGLPVRNADRHAVEISRMSLALLDAVDDFIIRHMPEIRLRVRIGIHSGPCAAGVVGHKMPRYCLFGDTVNTASRMESTGMAQRIHISYDTYKILKRYMSFEMKCRGRVNIKGKGEMTTYWLLGEKDGPKIPKYHLEAMAANGEVASLPLRPADSATSSRLDKRSSSSGGGSNANSPANGAAHVGGINSLFTNVAQLFHRLNDATIAQLGRHFTRGSASGASGNRKQIDTYTDTADIDEFDHLLLNDQDFIEAWTKIGKSRNEETGKPG